MIKKVIFILFIFIMPDIVSGLTYPELHYSSAIIYDMTEDSVIYSLNSDTASSIASLTKIMTTIVAIENIDNLNDTITYTDEMASLVRWDASVAGLSVGDIITYEDLLYASILPSGADATIALAISLSGSIDAYVELMNQLAYNLNLSNTYFKNVTGLDEDGQYSTAEDVLILLKYAMNNQLFKTIYTTKNYTLTNGLDVSSTLYYYAKDNYDTSLILGSKTGFTNKAGLCISAYFIVNNHEYLLITLGTEKDENFYTLPDTLELITFIDDNYDNQLLFSKDNVITTIKVKYSNIKEYTISSTTDIIKYLPNDYDTSLLEVDYDGVNSISFLTKKNTLLGVINYYYDNVLIASENVYLDCYIFINYFYIIIPIVIVVIILKRKKIKRLFKKILRVI